MTAFGDNLVAATLEVVKTDLAVEEHVLTILSAMKQLERIAKDVPSPERSCAARMGLATVGYLAAKANDSQVEETLRALGGLPEPATDLPGRVAEASAVVINRTRDLSESKATLEAAEMLEAAARALAPR